MPTTRQREPSLVDPRTDHDRALYRALGVASQREILAQMEANRTADRVTRKVPVVAGRWSDGSALRSLLAVLEDLGIISDDTVK